jgi:hypothetical protein
MPLTPDFSQVEAQQHTNAITVPRLGEDKLNGFQAPLPPHGWNRWKAVSSFPRDESRG